MKYRMLTCIIIAALVILFTNHCTKTEDVLTVDTIPPVVTVTHPHDAQTVSGTIDITADAVDNDTITQVVFVFIQWTDTYWLWLFAEEDISEPYEYKGFITTNYPDNTQIKIRVTGYDLAGNTADDEVIVIIDNQQKFIDIETDGFIISKSYTAKLQYKSDYLGSLTHIMC